MPHTHEAGPGHRFCPVETVVSPSPGYSNREVDQRDRGIIC